MNPIAPFLDRLGTSSASPPVNGCLKQPTKNKTRIMIKNKIMAALLAAGMLPVAAMAGTEWCAPSAKSCDSECCPDIGGSVSVGYDTDYVWRGVRFARDSVWADVNYTFENLPFSPNIGVWHLSSLGSGGVGSDAYGDETNVYAGISGPSILGFDTSLGYTGVFFPTTRGPGGPGGDSSSRITIGASRDLFWGIGFGYAGNYDFGATNAGAPALSSWFHEFSLSKSFAITDCIALDLGAEVAYNDGYWSGYGLATPGPGFAGGLGSGWNHYKVSAALPITLNCRTTLTPYVAYNGTPDAWIADGLNGGVGLANENDVFFGGVSLGVNF